ETLEDYGYQIQKVKQLHKMPLVKVLLFKTEDVVKILKDNDIQIGYSMVKVEPFDKDKSRPKSHFKKCRKCYRLNHIVLECPRKRKVSKYCGLANREAAKYRHKNNPSKRKCVLCRKQHPSDSLQCDVIRKSREKLGRCIPEEEGISTNSNQIKCAAATKELFLMLPKDNKYQMEMKARIDLRN
ncbi:hypothetical protein RFI_38298, partial [Reticulomyxa filosa]